VFTERRLAHPDREASWKDEATAIFGAAQRSLDLLDAHRAALHRATAQRVRAMLDRLTILHSDWTRQSHPTALPPSSQELREALARCERLMASVRSGAAE
jgi:hypothetical protein